MFDGDDAFPDVVELICSGTDAFLGDGEFISNGTDEFSDDATDPNCDQVEFEALDRSSANANESNRGLAVT